MQSEDIVFFESLAKNTDVLQAVSTRVFGSMKTNGIFAKGSLEKFLSKLKIDFEKAVFMKQAHGSRIKIVDTKTKGLIEGVDGMLTDKKNIFLCATTADCLPIAFYEPEKKIAGVTHAGYKGILKGILPSMVKGLIQLGADIKKVKACIGPGIGICCYDVKKQRVKDFQNSFPGFEDMFRLSGSRFFLDLKKITKSELIRLGIEKNNIEDLQICTKCNNERFFSFRGDTRESFGEFVTVIGVKKVKN